MLLHPSPEDIAKKRREKYYTRPSETVTCVHCGEQMRRDSLNTHILRHHPQSADINGVASLLRVATLKSFAESIKDATRLFNEDKAAFQRLCVKPIEPEAVALDVDF